MNAWRMVSKNFAAANFKKKKKKKKYENLFVIAEEDWNPSKNISNTADESFDALSGGQCQRRKTPRQNEKNQAREWS